MPHFSWFSSVRRRQLAALLAAMSCCSALLTYVVLNTMTDASNSTNLLHGLLLVNGFLLLALAVVVGGHVLALFQRGRASQSVSRLQRRIARAFALVALVPGALVAVFAGYLLYVGIHGWFSTRVSTALNESVEVAGAYLAEHRQAIRADIMGIAHELSTQVPLFSEKPEALSLFLNRQTAVRSLAEAVIFQPERIVALSELAFTLALETVPLDALKRAEAGEVVLLDGDEDDDRVRALMRIDRMPNSYLMVGRFIDPKVIGHVERTQGAVSAYQQLQGQIVSLQWYLFALFVLVTLVMLVLSLWYGLGFAAGVVEPVTMLVQAAEKVSAGDFSAKVPEGQSKDELALLSQTFNRMTAQLAQQRTELMEINRQMDMRHRFMEAVLSGVSAGVVALDAHQCITLVNRSAELLLDRMATNLAGTRLADLLPEVTPLLTQALDQPDRPAQSHMEWQHGERGLTLHARAVAEVTADGQIEGFVVTFDDITELQHAQRRAAWSNVARRIAHEIKNPLTPIQLAAERLRRKWGRNLTGEDKESFERYTETIIRHVGDIGAMVEEFVSFARMPAPKIEATDLAELLRSVAFSEECRHEAVAYVLKLPKEPVMMMLDPGQMRRAFSNLVKNAVEAIEGIDHPSITLSLKLRAKDIQVTVHDNGPGFPPDRISTLTEPYVTTRAKGTGLGLAIVKKIMEDHQASLELSNHAKGGAVVTVTFPRRNF